MVIMHRMIDRNDQQLKQLKNLVEPLTQGLAKMLTSPFRFTQVVTVPTSEHVAHIVGKSGHKIKNLRIVTNTIIKVPLNGDDPHFVVTGTQCNVYKAVEVIRNASHHFDRIIFNRSKMCGAFGEISIKVPVEYRYVAAVVGRNGHKIVSIRIKTKTRIITPKGDNRSPHFEIIGTPTNVEAAKKAILEQVNWAIANWKFHNS